MAEALPKLQGEKMRAKVLGIPFGCCKRWPMR